MGRVINISPADGSTNVAISTRIVIRFSEPVREAPLNQALSITSVAPQAGAVPPRDLAFNSDRTEVTITFRTPLSNDSVYRVTISRAVPDLFASGRSLAEDFVATFTTGNVAATGDPISLLPTQLAAVTPNGQVFSNPIVVPVGYGIRRAGVAENLPVGVRTDYRAVLSFPIPASIPANAVVQDAQLTLVQLPSNEAVAIGNFGDTGLGFFFLEPTPHNLPANNVVFQEVTLGAPNNVVSSDFFAPASTPSFIALSINGNVLGDDVSAGPRTADVQPGVQRAVSGSRFYQVRLQCAREVWNNQATPNLLAVGTASSSATFNLGTANVQFEWVGNATFAQTLLSETRQAAEDDDVSETEANFATINVTFSLQVNPNTSVVVVSGSTFAATFSPSTSIVTFSDTTPIDPILFPILFPSNSISSTSGPVLTTTSAQDGVSSTTIQQSALFSGQINPILGNYFTTIDLFSTVDLGTATFSFTVPGGQTYEVSQGANGTCRAEFDKEPAAGTGTQPLTTARGPRLDIRFTIPR